jgi:hypothetical protein
MNARKLLPLIWSAALALALPGSGWGQAQPAPRPATAKATFAGGCFWSPPAPATPRSCRWSTTRRR